MKSIIIILISIFSLSLKAFSCGEGAVVYKASFLMKDGSEVTGYFEVLGTEEYCYLDEQNKNTFCTNEGIEKLVRLWSEEQTEWVSSTNPDGTIRIFKEIYYPVLNAPDQPEDGLRIGIVTPEDRYILHVNEIVSVRFIDAEWSKREYYTADFLELPKETIDLINERSVLNQHFIYDEETVGIPYVMLNFNPALQESDLIRLKNLMIENLEFPELWDDSYIYFDEAGSPQYDLLKQKAAYRDYSNAVQETLYWFATWDIVLIEVWEGC